MAKNRARASDESGDGASTGVIAEGGPDVTAPLVGGVETVGDDGSGLGLEEAGKASRDQGIEASSSMPSGSALDASMPSSSETAPELTTDGLIAAAVAEATETLTTEFAAKEAAFGRIAGELMHRLQNAEAFSAMLSVPADEFEKAVVNTAGAIMERGRTARADLEALVAEVPAEANERFEGTPEELASAIAALESGLDACEDPAAWVTAAAGLMNANRLGMAELTRRLARQLTIHEQEYREAMDVRQYHQGMREKAMARLAYLKSA